MSKPSLSLFLDKRRSLKNETFPIKIRIIYKRQAKYYPTSFSLTEEEFINQRDCEQMRASGKIKIKEYHYYLELNRALKNELSKIEEIINSLNYFSFNNLEQNLNTEINQDGEIFRQFEIKINSLVQNGKIGNSNIYKDSCTSIKKYWKKEKLFIEDIDVKFLKKYEIWMIDSNGRSATTLSMYLRCLRAIYNIIIDHDKTKVESYPFNIKKYSIPTTQSEKRSLEISELKKIFEYQPEPMSAEEKYLDFWKLIFMFNGINVADLVKLKFSDLSNDEFKYIRAKTKSTNRNVKHVVGHFGDAAKEIIKKWGNFQKDKNDFVFPIINSDDNEVIRKTKVKNFTKRINIWMEKIGRKLEIEGKITTYVARHSFFSKVFDETGSLLDVMALAGHSSLMTSEKYVKSLRKKELKETLKNIANF